MDDHGRKAVKLIAVEVEVLEPNKVSKRSIFHVKIRYDKVESNKKGGKRRKSETGYDGSDEIWFLARLRARREEKSAIWRHTSRIWFSPK